MLQLSMHTMWLVMTSILRSWVYLVILLLMTQLVFLCLLLRKKDTTESNKLELTLGYLILIPAVLILLFGQIITKELMGLLGILKTLITNGMTTKLKEQMLNLPFNGKLARMFELLLITHIQKEIFLVIDNQSVFGL